MELTCCGAARGLALHLGTLPELRGVEAELCVVGMLVVACTLAALNMLLAMVRCRAMRKLEGKLLRCREGALRWEMASRVDEVEVVMGLA